MLKRTDVASFFLHQDKEKDGGGASIDDDTVKMIHDSAKTVAEMQGKIVLAEGHIEAHEQRLTDQGAQIYDLSAKVTSSAIPWLKSASEPGLCLTAATPCAMQVLTELEKELNGIRDDIQVPDACMAFRVSGFSVYGTLKP